MLRNPLITTYLISRLAVIIPVVDSYLKHSTKLNEMNPWVPSRLLPSLIFLRLEPLKDAFSAADESECFVARRNLAGCPCGCSSHVTVFGTRPRYILDNASPGTSIKQCAC